MKEIIGSVLVEYRKKAGLSQYELIDKINMSKAFLSEIENGKKMPSLETILRIAHGLNCPAWEIVQSIEERLKN